MVALNKNEYFRKTEKLLHDATYDFKQKSCQKIENQLNSILKR